MELAMARATIMELIQRSATALIDLPEHLSISMEVGEQTTVYKIEVHKDDVGKLLGKSGRNIQAIRELVKNSATKSGLRAVVLVED